MRKISEIISYIDSFAPLGSAMDFDNVGLLVGDENAEVHSALVALDITPEVVDEAKGLGAQLIISHHPVIFEPLKSVSFDSTVAALIKNGISAVCMHTNLDLSPVFGVNTCLAEAVGVKGSFVEGECLFVGELDSPMPNLEFARNVNSSLGCEGLRYTFGEKTVKRVALCSGSGGDYVSLAKKLGADVLLTGEIKHHQILEADAMDLAIVDVGHFKSEDVVISPLCEKLRAQFSEITFIRSQTCGDKIKYI